MNRTTNFHPDHNMLIEFSAGTLDTATSICSGPLHFVLNVALSLDQ